MGNRTFPEVARDRPRIRGGARQPRSRTSPRPAGFRSCPVSWRKFCACNPDSAAIHNTLGLALVWQKRTDEAIGHFKKPLRSIRVSSEAHQNWGDALFVDRGEIREALAALARGVGCGAQPPAGTHPGGSCDGDRSRSLAPRWPPRRFDWPKRRFSSPAGESRCAR